MRWACKRLNVIIVIDHSPSLTAAAIRIRLRRHQLMQLVSAITSLWFCQQSQLLWNLIARSPLSRFVFVVRIRPIYRILITKPDFCLDDFFLVFLLLLRSRHPSVWTKLRGRPYSVLASEGRISSCCFSYKLAAISGGSGVFIFFGVATLSSGGHTTNTFVLNYRVCNHLCQIINT